MGRKLGFAVAPLPVTDDLSARVVRLPMYYEITEKKQGRVADGLTACCPAGPPSCDAKQPLDADAG